MVKSIASISSKTILIVDDMPNILQLLSNCLNHAGYKILIAQNGKKALKVAEAMQPDLILLDVMMPDLDGFATCRYLKTNSSTKDIPVIFMTALAQPEEKLQGFMLGAVDYITKPIEEQELLARVKTHVYLQSLHQDLAQKNTRQKLLYEMSDRIRQALDLNLIFKITTKEIKSFLNCDLVALIQLQNQELEIKSYSASEEAILDKIKTISYDSLCADQKEYQSYLQGNIRIFQAQETAISKDSTDILKSNERLVVPIVINQIGLVPSDAISLDSSNRAINSSALYGWLIAERYQLNQQWQSAETSLLQECATQLAIAIKQQQLQQQVSELALLDSLTKVYNRRYFDQHLDLEWRRLQRISAPLALILCDLDYFKIYNDTYNNQQGDRCLQQISQVIATTLKRPGDVVARYSGEEFIIILPHTDLAGAVNVAQEIASSIKKLNLPHPNSLASSQVTISSGIASTIPSFADSPQLLLEACIVALREAQERGRDTFAVYSEAIAHSKANQELKFQWVQQIRQALTKDLFSLYAQPIAPLGINDSKKHFEILLRLTNEQNEIILPNAFLDIAERNFLMTDIDTWVINTLFTQLGEHWNLDHQARSDTLCWHNYCFSINLSGTSLNSESFMQFLMEKLLNSPLPPQIFCFEITETIAVSDLTRAIKFINALKELGCSFALDDFGKGMSSLTYLQNLPVDYLKIDGSFIRKLNNQDQASRVMIEAINHMATGIGLKTVAEFVENQTILDRVKELRVDYAQGFHLGRPGVLMEVLNSSLGVADLKYQIEK